MTAEARPDESTHGKVMHAAIQSGDLEAIARYRNAFPILEPFSDAAIQEGATPHNCSIALARERGFEGPYHLNRCFSENISVAPRETFEALKEAVKALDLSTTAEILDAFPYLARARVYNKDLGVERGASLLHLAMPRWAKDGGDQTTDQHIAMASLLIDRGTQINTIGDGGETPLGYVGWLGMKRFARYLFERGADPTVTTEWGFDALGTIADHGHVDLMEIFAEAGVSLTPRHLVQAQMTERLDVLEDADLHARCDIGHFDGERGTLMHVAANENLPAMIEYLHRRGVSLDDLDNFGRSPAQFAVERGRLEALGALADCGATLDAEAIQFLDDRRS